MIIPVDKLLARAEMRGILSVQIRLPQKTTRRD